jgi:hypothetical protein
MILGLAILIVIVVVRNTQYIDTQHTILSIMALSITILSTMTLGTTTLSIIVLEKTVSRINPSLLLIIN